MRFSELVASWKRDPRGTTHQLTTPVLLLERLGEGAAESWERTGAIFVGQVPQTKDPLVFFVEKVPRTGNAFTLGVTIGRVESNDIVIDDASISRFHAWLQQDPKSGGWLLCDAQSKNGTQLDGEPVESGSRVVLHDGAVIMLGQAALRFLLPQTVLELLKQ
ncbi:MAG: FHA domain-containing protein [Archangium sp.]|nr:FHA domain-containing protein [Archangium sp.]